MLEEHFCGCFVEGSGAGQTFACCVLVEVLKGNKIPERPAEAQNDYMRTKEKVFLSEGRLSVSLPRMKRSSQRIAAHAGVLKDVG